MKKVTKRETSKIAVFYNETNLFSELEEDKSIKFEQIKRKKA